MSFILCYYQIRKLDLKIINEHSKLLILRGLFGSIGLILYFYTIHHMPLGAAISILYLSPIFTVLLAIFIVKEPPTKLQIPFMLLSFIGVLLIKNIDSRISFIDLGIGILGSISAGVAYNIIRMLKGKVHHQLVIMYFPIVTIPITLLFLPTIWVTPNWKELALLLTIGVLTQIAQVFMTKAYQLERASKISHFNYITCVLAYLTGVIFFNEYMNVFSMLGLFCIFIGIRYTSKFANI